MELRHVKEKLTKTSSGLWEQLSHEAWLLQVCVRAPLLCLFTSGHSQRAQQDLAPHPTVREIMECAARKEVGKSPCLAPCLCRLVLECPCKPRYEHEVMNAFRFLTRKQKSCCHLKHYCKNSLSVLHVHILHVPAVWHFPTVVCQTVSHFVPIALQEFLGPLLIFFSFLSCTQVQPWCCV